MEFAPVLQEVAASIGGADPKLRREEPARWAYALREAVQLVQPDWVVTHHDPELEADAITTGCEEIGDIADLELRATPPVSSALELTETLTGIFSTGVVAASVTGPASIAARLASGKFSSAGDDDRLELLDLCGDAVADLAAAHVERGAQRLIVWEDGSGSFATEDVSSSHRPVVRRLEMLGVPAVLCAGDGIPVEGFRIYAARVAASGAALIDTRALLTDPEGVTDSLGRLFAGAEAVAGGDGVAITEGPIPKSCPMTVLARLGERTKVRA